jgi:hypothetical protein
MDLPSSKLSWHKRFISEGSGSCPSSRAINSGEIPFPLTNTDKEQYINHSDLVGCANYYTLLFLCPIIYLNYFWCIKYQHINIYRKIGKRKWERKKKKGFSASWAGGGVFGPAGRERARGRAGGRVGKRPTRPASGEDGVGMARGRCRGVGPHARGRGADGVER